MRKMPAPAKQVEVVALIKQAMDAGHAVILPRVDPALMAPLSREPPLVASCRWRFKLTRAEGRVLAKLLEHGHVSREAFDDGNPVTTVKSVDVVIYRLRRKLALHGIKIITLWGRGYGLAEGARARIRELLAKHGEGVMPAKADSEVTQ